MRALKLPLFALAGAMTIAPAMAQDNATDPAAPATAAPAPVSDAEVDQFATAVLAVDAVNKDTTIPAADKQTRMAAAVTANGLTAERFNAIAEAMDADATLQAKVGSAVQAKVQAAPAATPAPEPAPAPAQ